MNRKATVAMLGMALASLLSGCVVVDEHHEGDLDLFWDFEGYACYDVGVATTLVELWDHGMAGSPIASDYVDCQGNAINYPGLETGAYDFQLSGLSGTNVLLYYTAGTVDVHEGHNEYGVNVVRY